MSLPEKKLIIALTLTAVFCGLIAVAPLSGENLNAINPALVSPAPVAPHDNRSIRELDYRPGEILVQFAAGISRARAQEVISSLNSRLKREIPGPPGLLQLLTIPARMEVTTAIRRFERNPEVDFAQPNYLYRANVVPNDTDYAELWGLKNSGQNVNGSVGVAGIDIDAETAWDTITDCSSVVVAVADSGINYNHVDLSSNIWNNSGEIDSNGIDDDANGYVDDAKGWDMVQNDNTPMDLNGHGTHVAGSIGAIGNNGIGSVGVCWQVRLMPIRVLDIWGYGYSDEIVEGYYYAANNGARIINASLGSSNYDNAAFNAISYAATKDVLFVTSAGNSGANTDIANHYPSKYDLDNIVAVAALDSDGALSSFSNYGLLTVDVAAPGRNIYSSYTLDFSVGNFVGIGSIQYDSWNLSGAWSKDVTGSCGFWGGGTTLLTNPSTWCAGSGYYSVNSDERTWSTYDLSAYNSYDALVGLVPYSMLIEDFYDSFHMGYKDGSGDPFTAGGAWQSLYWSTYTEGNHDSGWMLEYLDLSSCRSGSFCSIGFRLESDFSITDRGVGVDAFNLYGFDHDNAHYDYLDGTSMAAPHVAGIAALTLARHPDFSYLDLVDAIMTEGIPDAALSNLTVSGVRASAAGSVKYIPPVEGIALSYP